MTLSTTPALLETRAAWHRVAEHVLAAGQFASTGEIRLRPYPSGFSTVDGVDGRQIAVVGDELAVLDGDTTRYHPLTTVGDAARFAGVEPGLRGSYPPATSADPDAPLRIDRGAARVLADWYALADAALRRFAEDLGEPADPILWPEHFDLGITVDATNYGASPGDSAFDDPYFYVGPHEGPTSMHDFWNTPFGAAVPAHRIPTTDHAVAFCWEGRNRIRIDRSTT
ncbi:hypothetical protein [Petropleomorpha daqingensis]|uniref:Uncharacterized protein n=1 Tax=Petropleomorpha daqingensis TaxID=2026353 RepID=A0A853CMZ2_9ACTN|nr:hypothetical protein [Petropleomorpha daqingensis]NYJ08561.1 hypothetical protein [Petropleomorpha daqingensis]